MKKGMEVMRVLLIFSSMIIEHNSMANMLTLKWPKSSNGSLKNEFLEELRSLFDLKIFVESGTFLGETVEAAIPVFNSIYSIELGQDLYNQAVKNFCKHDHVHLYHGSSDEIFRMLLPSIKNKGNILFWLDGHYSGAYPGGMTALGTKTTPIVEELLAIKEAGIKNAVILIDDLRDFDSRTDHPKIQKLHELILSIDNNYQFYIYGDVAIAFTDQNIVVSPLIKMLTQSKLYGKAISKEIIKEADSVEKKSLEILHERFGIFSADYCLWYNLSQVK